MDPFSAGQPGAPLNLSHQPVGAGGPSRTKLRMELFAKNDADSTHESSLSQVSGSPVSPPVPPMCVVNNDDLTGQIHPTDVEGGRILQGRPSVPMPIGGTCGTYHPALMKTSEGAYLAPPCCT